MLLLLRKALFYLLAVLYFWITPAVIFYALGYIYSPAEGELHKTGLVSIVTSPRSASVYVEGKRFSKHTPVTVRELLPGRYTIRVSSKGFDTWEKNVQIFPEKALRLDPILLLPKKPEVDDEILSEGPFENLIPGIFDSKIYAWKGRTTDTLWKIDLLFKKESRVSPPAAPHSSLKVQSILSKKGSPVSILETEQDHHKGFLALDLSQGKKMLRLPDNAAHFDWDPKNSNQIYLTQAGKLMSLDLRRGRKEEIARGIFGFGMKHQHLYLLSHDLSLIRTDRHGKNPEVLLEDSEILKAHLGSEKIQFCKIEILKRDFFQRDLFLFLTEDGALWSNWPPYLLSDRGILGFEYSSHSEDEKILIWTANQIGIINFEKNEKLFFNAGSAADPSIRQAFWAYEDTHVIFLYNDHVYLLETQGAQPYLLRPLAEVCPGTSILYNDRSHALYFINPQKQLVRRKVGE